ncbi:unnamed protein product [Rotaria socialis]
MNPILDDMSIEEEVNLHSTHILPGQKESGLSHTSNSSMNNARLRTSQPVQHIQVISNQNSHANSIRTSPQGIGAFALNSSTYNIPRMDQNDFVPSSIMATEITRSVVDITGIHRFSTKRIDTINNNRRKTIRLTDDRNGPHQIIHHIHGLALTRNQIIANMTTNVAHEHCRPSSDDTPFGTQVASMTAFW